MKIELAKMDWDDWAATQSQALCIVAKTEGLKSEGSDEECARMRLAEAVGAGALIEGEVSKGYEVKEGLVRRDLHALAGKGPDGFKKAAVKLAAAIKESGVAEAVVFIDRAAAGDVGTLILAVKDAVYVYAKSKPSAKASKLKKLVVGVADAKGFKAEFDRSMALAAGIELARHWGDSPANMARPKDLGEAAEKIAASCKRMKFKQMGPKEIAKLGMGSFMAVAKGSDVEPRLIELSYQGGKAGDAPLVLVGKGITFDSGGISLKPGAEMDEMKFDMCGAASVLGVFEALAKLGPKINVVGLVAAAENMPGPGAVKPGDVVTSMSGQTIEILNTDAEGRLVLCDALTYAKRFKPAAVVDIATLTGACVIALGAARSGMYANDEALAAELFASGERAGDKCWRMPLDEEYAEGLKSNFADMGNIAGRGAGSVTAAKFLQKFVDYPWGHLDIAGTAWKGGAAKGSTGRPMGLLLDFVLSRVKK